jgi:hypothetical protein
VLRREDQKSGNSLSTVQGVKEERKLEGGLGSGRREGDSLAVASRVLTATKNVNGKCHRRMSMENVNGENKWRMLMENVDREC